MDVAVASAHRTLTRAEIGAARLERRFAPGKTPRLVANERREYVALFQKQPAGHADRLLPAADVNATGDHPAAIETGELLLKDAGEEHPAERFEIPLVRRGLGRGGIAGTFRGLQHLTI